MNCLLHCCCAPCSIKCVDSLINEDIAADLFWYNPNIHPATEYLNRRDTFINYARNYGLNYSLADEYGLRMFIIGVSANLDNRCEYCYKIRLEATAAYAAKNNYDCFSTTLLISPYQNHDLLRLVAEETSRRFNIPFLYRDFRSLFREGQKIARDSAFYMQKYCGCIFSEEERYKKRLTS